MSTSNITYLLGAGASFNSVPTVEELSKSFKKLAHQCKRISFGVPTLKKHIEHNERFIDGLNKLYKQSEIFGTVDTYAKKLALNGNDGLDDLKAVLSIFFVIWQEVEKRVQLMGDPTNNKVYKIIDKRYHSILSNFLKKTDKGIQLPPNFRFISWNYDIQLERAIQSFTGYEIHDVFREFEVYPYKTELPTDKTASIVHLNGIAGLYKTNEGTIQSLFNRGPRETLGNVLENILFFLESTRRGQIDHNSHFSYAWEEDEISKQAIVHANNIMASTEVLVIIGYSFPAFNSEVDKQLFESLRTSHKLKKIYYQDPNASEEFISNRFDIPLKYIIANKDCKQFEIPLKYL